MQFSCVINRPTPIPNAITNLAFGNYMLISVVRDAICTALLVLAIGRKEDIIKYQNTAITITG